METTASTKTRTSKKPLKCIPIPSQLKPLVNEATLGFKAPKPENDPISMTSVKYKNETYLIVVRKERDIYATKPDLNKYKELKELKAFLGRGKDSLKTWNNYLDPRYIKQCMRSATTPQKTREIRNLYRFPNQDVSKIQKVRTCIANYRDLLVEIQHDWSYTPAGCKSDKRQDARKTIKKSKRLFGTIYSNMVGGVHEVGGLYLKAHKEKLSKILDLNKKPMTSERHIGLELEFCLPHKAKEAIKEALVNSPYTNMLCLTRDGSVTSNEKYEPAELKICSPISQLTDVVSFVCKVLTLNNCVVDTTCGLHVHLDARKDDVKAMFDKLLDQQSSLFALVPKSRRNNQYCRPTTKKDFRRGSRYKSINSTAYSKFQTLEVRLHGGTIDPNKIINWTLLLTSIAYNEQKITKSRTIATLVKKLALGETMTSFILDRAAKFNEHGDVVISTEDAAS